MQFISTFFASFVDKFKVSNPTAFMVIQFVLFMLVTAMLNCGEVFGFCATEVFGKATTVVTEVVIGLGFVLGSRTSRFVQK